jgi:uncharacterized protein HemX
MSRSRKQDSGVLRLVPVAQVFVVCTLLGGAGVGYVWQKEQIGRLSQQIRDREEQLRRQLDENENRKMQLANMRSPPFLEKKIKELNLGLMAPQPTQVWRLVEPPRASAKPGRDPQWAVQVDPGAGGPRTNEPLSP